METILDIKAEPFPFDSKVGQLEMGELGTTSPAQIRCLQKSLNKLFNTNLSVDGKFGVKTRGLLQNFQRISGLPPTGYLDARTLKILIRRRMQLNEIYHDTSTEVEGEAVAIATLGVAVFSLGKDILTSGDFSTKSNVVSYIHPHTPISQHFRKVEIDFRLIARHSVLADQYFWFKLSYEYNGNDIRDALINPLVHRSSSTYVSTFTINFQGDSYSPPQDPVAEIVFNISGRWDPSGPGNSSFQGKLFVKADGSMPRINFQSESNAVRFDRFITITAPFYLNPQTKKGTIPLRPGSRGSAVRYLQQQLNTWADATYQPVKLKIDGVYGPATARAVRLFQQQAGLKVDGIAGAETRNKMRYLRV